jgi:hypothetical protein
MAWLTGGGKTTHTTTKPQTGGNHLITTWTLQNTLEQVARSVGLFTLPLTVVPIKLLFFGSLQPNCAFLYMQPGDTEYTQNNTSLAS